jgi:NADP-dependent alcohol dehydrogenase
MLNFTYCNPVKIVFGKGTIAELSKLVPAGAKVMMTYGGGSIKQNSVYDQVQKALAKWSVVEFSGIEPNPKYETCMRAVELARTEKVAFLLSVGGGSVLDGTKFIAAAVNFTRKDPWDMTKMPMFVPANSLPLGCVLTLPATGSEMNPTAVISRESTGEKLVFSNPALYPKFSILDPETTFSLPPRQTANGIVDAFIHVMEQYLTYDVDAPLQDRQAEAILLTLLEEGPKVMADPTNYNARANVMWAATNALNGSIGCGVPQDWATHIIGHELTALYGIDHAQTLAVVYPGTLMHMRERKRKKLLQYADRVWRLTREDENTRMLEAIEKTDAFFRSLGVYTKLTEYGIPSDACKIVADRLGQRGRGFGETAEIKAPDVEAILTFRV